MPSKTNTQYTLPNRLITGKARASRPGTGVKNGETIRNTLNQYIASEITKIQNRGDVNQIIRTLTREDGMFASAANSMVALVPGSGYTIAGYSADGSMDMAVMAAAYSLMDQIDTSHDYREGFNDKDPVRSLSATMIQDVVGTGGCGGELLLDQQHIPQRIVPIGYSTITWVSDGKGGRYPQQPAPVGQTKPISLDFPTVFIGELNRNSDEAYAVSLLRPGLSQVFQFNEFTEDMHRALNRVGHSRLISKISQDAVTAMAPPDVAADPKKMADFYNSVKAQVEDALAGLEPEDALVSYDTVTNSIEDVGGTKSDYSSLLSTLGNMLGVSLKTPASVSGLRTSGTQALSNAETLIYLKVVQACAPPVEAVFSRMLTLAIRLLGIDGYATFEFKPVNLRPDTELEAYFMSKQKRVLELLTYGLISDAQACYMLGLRPQDYTVTLSGTHFLSSASTQSNGGSATAGERVSSAGRSLNPGTPPTPGG